MMADWILSIDVEMIYEEDIFGSNINLKMVYLYI